MNLFRKMACAFMVASLTIANSFAQCEKLVWSDEFDGTTLNTSNWAYELGDGCPNTCQWGTGQLDYSTNRPENVKVENGSLYLTIRKETNTAAFNGREYTSGRIRTYQKKNFKYGRIEARVKGVYSPGMGFAFWTLGSNFESVSWPKCGEIDIFEQTGKAPSYNIATTHFQESWGHAMNQGNITLPNGQRFADDFHVVGLIWTPDSMSWYLDSPTNIYHTFYYSEGINGYDPFNRDQFLILSVGMGGDYSGLPDGTTVTPQSAMVDYVRVYEGPYSVELSGDNKLYASQTSTYTITPVTGSTYIWSVPSGATIQSGQGTTTVNVLWGGPQSSGDVKCTVTPSGCPTKTYSQKVKIEPALVIDKVYDNFESTRTVTYDYIAGTLTQPTANPGSNSINSSTQVAKYVRNAGQQWDAITMINFNPGHAGEFKQGKKRFFIDVYTDAPVGTQVNLGLENSAVAVPEYPYGKHSNYQAITTVRNQWETLEFTLSGVPDNYAGAYKVNKAVLMFDMGNFSGNTYYFDNFRSGQAGPEAPILSTDVYENWNGTSKLPYLSSTGTYSPNIANPASSTVNNSSTVLRYVRNAGSQYDNIAYSIAIDDASVLKSGDSYILMDIYTTASAGKVISLHLENSTIDGTADWQAPIHSIYEGKITKQGTWETVAFKWSSTPNAAIPNASVNKLVVLIDETLLTGDTYYIDNIRIASTKNAPVFSLDKVLANYDGTNYLNLNYTGETYVSVANPNKTGINTSTNTGRYTRTIASDWLVFDVTTPLDAVSLKDKLKVFEMDVMTNAPVGTVITLGLEANTLANPNNWPTGRHSDYAAVTKAQNTWHTVRFIYSNSADQSTPSNLVNKMIITANQGVVANYTYYFDNIRILKSASSTPPVANAGADKSISLPTNSVTLAGSGTDADGTITTYAWTKVSGGAATITSPAAAQTSITGLVAGTYVFRLTVTDNSGLTSNDDVTVAVGTIPVNCNLISLNKPALASSFEGANTAASALDGSMTSRWGSAFTDAEWIQIDLQSTYSVCEVRLYWEGAYGKNYEIRLGATNNINASSVIATVTNGDGGTDLVSTNQTINGRYIWMKGVTRATGWGYSLWEMEVYGNGGTPVNNAPFANAGADKVITLPVNTVVLTGSATDADGTITAYAWTKISGGAATIASPAAATTAINGLVQGTYVFRLTATDNLGATGFDEVTVIVNPIVTNCTLISQGKPATSSSFLGAFTAAMAVDVSATTRWESAYADPQWITIDLQNTYSICSVELLWETASGKAYQIQLSNDVNFGTFSVIASETNGNGATDLLTTDATKTGRYIRMYGTARNTGYGYSLFDFKVNGTIGTPVNVAPTADAGADKSITLPTNSASLTGSGSDTDGTISSYAWTKVSGGAATITTANAASTTVTGLVQGTYVFRLTVADNAAATGADDVTVVVNPANVNIAPTANAGVDKTITLPANSVSLTGTGSDTDGTISSYAWTKVSGGAATITTANAASTTVTGLVQGTYVFRLTVADNAAAIGADDITVVVNPAIIVGNIALNKAATASTTQAGLLLPSVNDGVMGTRWGSEWSDPQWVSIDLGAEYTISRVVLQWEGAFGKAYQIQLSNSASFATFNVIASEANGNGATDDLTTTTAYSGRYIRMYGTARGTGYGYSLWEFEAYGTLKSAGSSEKSTISDILLYPNPANKELNIFTAWTDYSAEIYDMHGKLQLKMTNLNGLVYMNTAEWKQGIYIVRLTDKAQSQMIRLVIE